MSGSSVKLMVIFGGDTPEHEVSLAGAQTVLMHAYARVGRVAGWRD